MQNVFMTFMACHKRSCQWNMFSSEHDCTLKEGKREMHEEVSKHQMPRFKKITRQRAKREGLVKVPKIYWEFTTKGILTMEWIEGIKLTDKEALAKANLDIQELVDQGVFCSLRQLLEDGFFHADPHPGNFVVTKEGVLAYFDFGMMGDFPRNYRVGLIRTLVHFMNRDSEGLSKDFLSLGFLPHGADLELIAQDLRSSFGEETSKSQLDFQVIAIAEQSGPSENSNQHGGDQQTSKRKGLSGMRSTSFDTRAVAAATADLLSFILSDKGLKVRSIITKDINSACDLLIYSFIYTFLDVELQTRTDIGNMSETPKDNTSHEVHSSGDRSTVKPYDDHKFDNHSGNAQSSIRTQKELRLSMLSDNYRISNVFGWTFNRLLGETGNKDGSMKDRMDMHDFKDRTETDTDVNVNLTRKMNDQDSQKEGNTDESHSVDLGLRLQTALYAFVKAIEAAPEVWIPLLATYMAKPEASRLFGNVACAGGHSFCQHLSEATFLSISKNLHDSRI
ncbi:hypothetical protein O6H91_19G034900 [Diphasiastrum complanatum]|uniref:Uncharacterized protein n=1 Tax=Diphasiastrum complanatum TaxID=34168 RepID=A0ACC2AU31_DIPCM|nr:hypothetical protein O6H91_19G034900 [Diphasiastrum complanatum]